MSDTATVYYPPEGVKQIRSKELLITQGGTGFLFKQIGLENLVDAGHLRKVEVEIPADLAESLKGGHLWEPNKSYEELSGGEEVEAPAEDDGSEEETVEDKGDEDKGDEESSEEEAPKEEEKPKRGRRRKKK